MTPEQYNLAMAADTRDRVAQEVYGDFLEENGQDRRKAYWYLIVALTPECEIRYWAGTWFVTKSLALEDKLSSLEVTANWLKGKYPDYIIEIERV